MGTCAGGTWQAGHNASREKDRAKGQGVTGSLWCPHARYLKEGESSPLQLLCTLRRLDKPHEASFPDLQDKKWGGDMLLKIQRVRPKRMPVPLIF